MVTGTPTEFDFVAHFSGVTARVWTLDLSQLKALCQRLDVQLPKRAGTRESVISKLLSEMYARAIEQVPAGTGAGAAIASQMSALDDALRIRRRRRPVDPTPIPDETVFSIPADEFKWASDPWDSSDTIGELYSSDEKLVHAMRHTPIAALESLIREADSNFVRKPEQDRMQIFALFVEKCDQFTVRQLKAADRRESAKMAVSGAPSAIQELVAGLHELELTVAQSAVLAARWKNLMARYKAGKLIPKDCDPRMRCTIGELNAADRRARAESAIGKAPAAIQDVIAGLGELDLAGEQSAVLASKMNELMARFTAKKR